MAPLNEHRTLGLEDLRWQSLTRPEKLLVAGMLEVARDAPAYAHLENVAFELRECSGPGTAVPLVLTSLQNRAVAQVLDKRADEIEHASERFASAPALSRSAHYAAGYLRSLLDRLVRGAVAEKQAGLERIMQLLLLDTPQGGVGARHLVDATAGRLKQLGLDDVFLPVLGAYAAEAAAAAAERGAGPAVASASAAFEFEIVDETEERVMLAERIFAAAMATLGRDERAWSGFVASLGAGTIKGCERAREYSDVAESAASIAYAIAGAVRRHLSELEGAPWEAVRPGLQSILDAHPGLKKVDALKEFVKGEVRRHYGGFATA